MLNFLQLLYIKQHFRLFCFRFLVLLKFVYLLIQPFFYACIFCFVVFIFLLSQNLPKQMRLSAALDNPWNNTVDTPSDVKRYEYQLLVLIFLVLSCRIHGNKQTCRYKIIRLSSPSLFVSHLSHCLGLFAGKRKL